MNKSQLEKYRVQLEALRDRVRQVASSVTEQARGPSGGQADGALTNAPFHLGDGGTEEFLQDMNAALLENEQYLVNEARTALERIERGDFGKCENCGRPIAKERLDAMPYARFCITCAAANNAGVDVNVNTGRPHVPADTIAPEGSMQEDWRMRRDPLSEAEPTTIGAVDVHAAGEPGGGGAFGGLAGGTEGHGEPTVSDLQQAAGSSDFDANEGRDENPEAPRSGRSGGAVGGTPARKRTK